MSSTEKPKPGQKFPTPTPGFGDRVFYETLLRNRPGSFMAQEWCLNYGVLSRKKAEKLLVIVTERKRKQRTGTAPPPAKKKKSKIVKEEAIDPDGATAGGPERVGSAVL